MRRELRPEGAIYKIEEVVGQGLSATVYRAIRIDSRGHSQQMVALKVLKSRNTVPWLRREFEALARVKSSHCVRVLGWENLAEGSALVLEWIDGVDLLELARFTRLNDRMIAEVMAQTREGLRAIAAEGLHHGDLSPKNIVIDRTGRVRIIDFGAFHADADDDIAASHAAVAANVANAHFHVDAHARTDVIHGTPAYLSPEVWRGERTSIRSDLFALGLIEHDLKTGFREHPLSQTECRERASAISLSGRIDIEPSSFLTRSYEPDEQALEELGDTVRALLGSKAAAKLGTAVLTVARSLIETPRLRWRTPLTAFAFFCCVWTPGLSYAPLFREPTPTVTVEFRSFHWLEVRWNGRTQGYAPLQLRGIRAGSHRIEWRTAHASGELKIDLKPGQRLRLTEKDLMLLPRKK